MGIGAPGILSCGLFPDLIFRNCVSASFGRPYPEQPIKKIQIKRGFGLFGPRLFKSTLW